MSTVFKNNRFYPQQFLLLSDSGVHLDDQISSICQEAFRLSPDSFNGESLFFKFILHYCPPYEHDRYRELKRLQEVSRNHIRFKNEYKGYIAIDVSEWEDHFEEELFSVITMSFLSDMSDSWKYIFILNGKNDPNRFKRISDKYLKFKQITADEFHKTDDYLPFFETINRKHSMNLTADAANIFHRYVPEKAIRDKGTAILIERDMKNYFGINATINNKMLFAYLTDPDGVCFEMIEEKDMHEICRIIEEEQRH